MVVCHVCQMRCKTIYTAHSEKKEEPKWLLRGTGFVHRTDPFVAPFFYLFFFAEKCVESPDSVLWWAVLASEDTIWWLYTNGSSLQKGAIFQNGSSEALFWLHFFLSAYKKMGYRKMLKKRYCCTHKIHLTCIGGRQGQLTLQEWAVEVTSLGES